MGSHDGGVDHGPLVVGVLSQGAQHAQPHAGAAPARVAQMHDTKVAKVGGQIAPRDACAVAVEHGVDEQAVVAGCGPGLTGLAGQQVLDALPLGITEGVALCHEPSDGAQRVSFKTPRLLIDDTP